MNISSSKSTPITCFFLQDPDCPPGHRLLGEEERGARVATMEQQQVWALSMNLETNLLQGQKTIKLSQNISMGAEFNPPVQASLLRDLACLPVSSDTRRVRMKRQETEVALADLDDRCFHPKVFLVSHSFSPG